MEGESVYGELLANSSGARGDSRVTPGDHGVKEAEIAASHPHLSAEVEVKGMSETWLLFLTLELWTLWPVKSLGDFYSSSLSSRLACLAQQCRSLQNLFSTQLRFPEPIEVHFLRKCFPREFSVIAKRSYRNGLKGWCWQQRSTFFLHISLFPLADIFTKLRQLASINFIKKKIQQRLGENTEIWLWQYFIRGSER